jgi:hypothetical protein
MALKRIHNRMSESNNNKEITIGEIKIDFKENKMFKEEELYYVIYKYKFKKFYNSDEFIVKPNFYAILKKTLYNSYIFKNVSKYENIKSHKNCSLTVPIDWVDMIEIYKLLPKIPSDIIVHEIMEFL